MATSSRRGAGRDTPPTPELVREALSFINPDIGHDDRARLAFAVQDALGEDGRDLWMSWAGSRAAADQKEDIDTWKSCRKPGPIRVGTLFGMAKDRGFKFPDAADYVPPDPAVLAAQAEKRARERKLLEEQYRVRAEQAQRVARGLWSEAERNGAPSPYLQRKGVQAYGVRTLPDGTLLVPMRDAAGELKNVQRIAPAKPPDPKVPEKRYLPGGPKKQLLHLIGGAGVCTRDGEPVPVLLLAEGYATAASLHEATGRPVAVCFDAGNLKAVAIDMRELHPTALMVVCGDDDKGTEDEKGRNPGRKAAEAAMRAAITDTGWAMVVMPAGLPEGGTDFNDLHMHAGLDEVRKQLAYEITCELATLSAKAEPAPAAEPMSDFERDCLAGEGAAPWAGLDDLVRAADAEQAAAGGASSPPPSPDAAAPRAPTEGEGVVLEFPTKKRRKGKAGDPAEDAAIQAAQERKRRELLDKVGTLTERFTFIYSTDTAWDGLKAKLINVANMRLAFGKDPVNMWLGRPSRRTIDLEDLVFEPGVEVPDHQVNMFEGLELEPVLATAADVEPMLRLLRYLCSKSQLVTAREDGYANLDVGSADDVDAVMHWLLCWIALPLQQVGTKMATAVVMHGPQGSGKNLFFDAWRDLYGKYGKTIGQTEIEDKYNAWISCKLAFVANEVVSRQEMYHRKDALKMIVTEGKGFPVRGMHKDTRWERNAANIVFLSNQRVPLALDDGDRRHLVIYTPLADDDSLYQVVVAFLERGGLAKWLHYLQAYDVGDFTAHTKPPMTRDKERLIQASWKAPARFASDWMEGYLDLPMMVCSGDQLYRAFQRWCVRSGERFPPNRETFTEEVHRWAAETAGRDQQGRRLAPRLECKPVQHKDSTGKRRSIRTWIPDGCGPRADVTSLGEWAFESAAVFQKELDTFCGSLGFNEGNDK